jgi:hypothetical protein
MKNYLSGKNKDTWEKAVTGYFSELYEEEFVQVEYIQGCHINAMKPYIVEDEEGKRLVTPRSNIIAPPAWKHWFVVTKCYANWRYYQFYGNNLDQLEVWFKKHKKQKGRGDVLLYLVHITHTLSLVIVEEKYGWNTEGVSHTRYVSAKSGTWIAMAFDKFFELNKDRVKELSMNGYGPDLKRRIRNRSKAKNGK